MPQVQQEAMIRKPILMPKDLVAKVDTIAKAKKVSFAEVVRDAVEAYDLDLTSEESKLLEALVDTYIKSTKETIEKIDRLMARMDETHEKLKEHAYGVSG
jgi:metal-responsive CopG/Arc/MetJ family transcriptional regulator